MIEIKESTGHVAIFIRHAERENANMMNVGENIMLTRKGIVTSHQLGRMMKGLPVRAIYSSPILRCVQTANAINAEVSNYAIETVLTNKLGLPGLTIADADKSEKLYAQYTTREIYDRYTHDEKMDALTTPSVLANKTLDFLHSACKEEGVYLFISHDSTIAHIRYALTKYVYPKEQWVDFLDGFVINL